MEQNNNSKINLVEELSQNQIDMAAFLRAFVAISEQLLPETLAGKLMQIIMLESGADKGCILLERKGQFLILAESFVKNGTDIKTYVDLKTPDYNFLPEMLIEDVKKRKEQIIINDVSTNKKYESEKYFLSNHPKSIACIPVFKEQKIMGIIYLENNHFSDVFTINKISILKILTTQASVSFENMVLFNKLDLSKKRFQDIMDNSTAVIFAKLLDGRYLFINKEFEKLYKVNRENVVNLTDFDIFPKDFAESFIRKDKIITETVKPLTYEETIPHDDGLHTYIIAKFPLHNAEGKFYAIAGIATDTTELKRLEHSLRENQNRFNYVLAATQDAIYDWDLVSGRIWRNEQYEKLFDGPMGPNFEWWKHNIHPDEFIDVSSRLEEAFRKHDQLWNQEYRFKKITDGYAYVIDRGYIIYNNERKPIRMIGALMDITERKRFTDDLERSLALSRATLESTTDGILVVNSDEKIVDYNKRFVEMWNIPDSILQTKDDKKTIESILSQLKDADKFVAKVKQLYASPESESFDEIEFKDGRTFERYSKPQKTKLKTIGRVWSFRDVTQNRKQLESEKIKTAQMLFRQQELLKLTSFKSEQSIQEKYNIILASSANVLQVERVSICFFNESKTELSSASTYQLSKNIYLQGVSFQKKDYPRFFQELISNRIMDANDALDDPRTSELNQHYLQPMGIVSILCIPVRLGEKLIGVILHEHLQQKRIWSYDEQAFAYSISAIVTLAVENDDKLKILNNLKESEQLFKLAISQLPILFAVFDSNLRWTMAGGKILDSLGLKSQTLIGKTLFQTNDTIDINITKHKEALNGKSSVYDYKLGETYLQRFVEPLKNNEGKIVGVISMSLDVTEREKMNLKIKELNLKLEECLKDTKN